MPGRSRALSQRVLARHAAPLRAGGTRLARSIVAARVPERIVETSTRLAQGRSIGRAASVPPAMPDIPRPPGMSEFAARWLFGDGRPEGIPIAGEAALAGMTSGRPAFLEEQDAREAKIAEAQAAARSQPVLRGQVDEVPAGFRLSRKPVERPAAPPAPVPSAEGPPVAAPPPAVEQPEPVAAVEAVPVAAVEAVPVAAEPVAQVRASPSSAAEQRESEAIPPARPKLRLSHAEEPARPSRPAVRATSAALEPAVRTAAAPAAAAPEAAATAPPPRGILRRAVDAVRRREAATLGSPPGSAATPEPPRPELDRAGAVAPVSTASVEPALPTARRLERASGTEAVSPAPRAPAPPAEPLAEASRLLEAEPAVEAPADGPAPDEAAAEPTPPEAPRVEAATAPVPFELRETAGDESEAERRFHVDPPEVRTTQPPEIAAAPPPADSEPSPAGSPPVAPAAPRPDATGARAAEAAEPQAPRVTPIPAPLSVARSPLRAAAGRLFGRRPGPGATPPPQHQEIQHQQAQRQEARPRAVRPRADEWQEPIRGTADASATRISAPKPVPVQATLVQRVRAATGEPAPPQRDDLHTGTATSTHRYSSAGSEQADTRAETVPLPAGAPARRDDSPGPAPEARLAAPPRQTARTERPALRLVHPAQEPHQPALARAVDTAEHAPAIRRASSTSGERLAAGTGAQITRNADGTETVFFPHPPAQAGIMRAGLGSLAHQALDSVKPPATGTLPSSLPSMPSMPQMPAMPQTPRLPDMPHLPDLPHPPQVPGLPQPPSLPAGVPGAPGGGGDIDEIYDQVIERLRRDLLADRERMGDVLGDLP